MSNAGPSSKPCRFFGTAKGCPYGKRCRFSHQSSHTSNAPAAIRAPIPSQTTAGKRGTTNGGNLAQWKFLIPAEPQARGLGTGLNRFLKTAEELVARDFETAQQVITKLATEGGLTRIHEVVQHLSDDENALGISSDSVFTLELLPLLRTLSHSHVSASLILEGPLETILTFIHGPAGKRGKTIFEFAAQKLEERVQAGASDSAEELEACVVVLARVVDLHSSAALSGELQNALHTFDSTFERLSENDGMLRTSQSAKSIRKLHNRFGTGHTVPEAPVAERKKSKAVFELSREAPGNLSDLGRRHDNDKDDICQIVIMPTASEFKAQRQDYLPTSTFSPHCEDNMRGLLDRQFRLLREDTVGPLRDAVREEHAKRRDPKNKAITGRQAARTFTYSDAALQRISVDPMHGIELEYEFDQPEKAKKCKQENERKKWWSHSKRLQHGALVCVLDFHGAPLFCTVSGE